MFWKKHEALSAKVAIFWSRVPLCNNVALVVLGGRDPIAQSM